MSQEAKSNKHFHTDLGMGDQVPGRPAVLSSLDLRPDPGSTTGMGLKECDGHWIEGKVNGRGQKTLERASAGQ